MIFEDLVKAIEESDMGRIGAMRETISTSDDPWEIHLSLYPAVARVLNPPFINPHLPKMYNICRDFVPYLSKEGLRSLVYLELVEYARRAKIEILTPRALPQSRVDFTDIEKAIAEKKREKVVLLLCAFIEQQGLSELVRRFLLLGSGYLNQSLGHSVSCSAFILLELLERRDIDAWPVLVLLADYFCKGGFHTTPSLIERDLELPLGDYLSRSVTGSGFVDLHHTITLYAIERTHQFLTSKEHSHMIAAWAAFIGDKQSQPRSFPETGRIEDRTRFHESFSRLDADLMMELTGGMIARPDERFRLAGFLVTSVCDIYQGDYDPHYLTGLGSLLWVMNAYHHDINVVQNALYQYLDFYFRNLRSKD